MGHDRPRLGLGREQAAAQQDRLQVPPRALPQGGAAQPGSLPSHLTPAYICTQGPYASIKCTPRTQGFLLSKIKIALERLTIKLIILQVRDTHIHPYVSTTFTHVAFTEHHAIHHAITIGIRARGRCRNEIASGTRYWNSVIFGPWVRVVTLWLTLLSLGFWVEGDHWVWVGVLLDTCAWAREERRGAKGRSLPMSQLYMTRLQSACVYFVIR